MPLTHTTDWWVFREIFERGDSLKPTFCSKYNDDLLYLFYGRPSYRPHSDVEPTSLSSFFLICILFEPSGVDPFRVMPFDSGAMIRGHYASHLHPRMTPADFELEPSVSRVTCAIDRFYGSNSAYFQGVPRSDVAAGPRDLEVETFLSIIKSLAQGTSDDRRSTIEFQLKHQIDLRTSKVLAVILPEQLLADPTLEDFIEIDLQAEALDYFCPHARPSEDARAIMSEAKRFYERRGWL